jgi:hypothetical protein
MPETRSSYLSTADHLHGFAEEVRPVLRHISNKPQSETAGILVQFVASIVHPDFVCNLAMMDCLAPEAKEAVLKMFQFCLKTGLSIEEQGAILAFVQPYIVSLLGGKPAH